MAFDIKGTIYIPGEAFWEWVEENFSPSRSPADEVSFGEPVWNDAAQEFEIRFSASTCGTLDEDWIERVWEG